MIKKNWLNILLAVVFVISYFRVPFIFFLQDELFTFGLFFRDGWKYIFHNISLSELIHFVPFSKGLTYMIFSIFGLNSFVFNLFGLLIHVLNGFLVYRLAKIVFKNNILPVISSIIFFSCSQASEIVMWPVASLNMLSLSFILLAILYYLKRAARGRQFKLKNGIIISLLFLASLFMVEYSIMFSIFFPLMVLSLYKNDKKSRANLLLPFVGAITIYLFLRFVPAFLFSQGEGLALGVPREPIFRKISDFIMFPFIYTSQLFLGQDLLLRLSKFLSSDTYVIESEVYKYLAQISGFAIIIGLLLFVYRKLLKVDLIKAKFFLLFLFSIFASSLPFVLVFNLSIGSSIIPSRYMCFGSVGYSLVLTYFVYIFQNKIKVTTYPFLIFVIILVVYGSYLNFDKSGKLYFEGKERLGILNQIKIDYPTLPERVVFYFLSDKSYYGLSDEERILPFQSGLGQTLLVWYGRSEKFPKEFFADRFLWDITSEGYKEIEGVGFGFFRDFEKMASILKDKNLPPVSIIAFRYNSVFNKLDDITKEVRGGYLGYLANIKEVRSNNYLVITEANKTDIYLATDGKRKTFWDSKIVYAYPQSLEIKLKRKTKIAQIQIDSYNNKDKNQVGYKVSLMDDSGNWHEVFYAKRYPPNIDGIVNLYFEPTKTSRVKIEQTGYHAFATWVVHELKIYEAVD